MQQGCSCGRCLAGFAKHTADHKFPPARGVRLVMLRLDCHLHCDTTIRSNKDMRSSKENTLFTNSDHSEADRKDSWALRAFALMSTRPPATKSSGITPVTKLMVARWSLEDRIGAGSTKWQTRALPPCKFSSYSPCAELVGSAEAARRDDPLPAKVGCRSPFLRWI
jgi:hypothetical protein